MAILLAVAALVAGVVALASATPVAAAQPVACAQMTRPVDELANQVVGGVHDFSLVHRAPQPGNLDIDLGVAFAAAAGARGGLLQVYELADPSRGESSWVIDPAELAFLTSPDNGCTIVGRPFFASTRRLPCTVAVHCASVLDDGSTLVPGYEVAAAEAAGWEIGDVVFSARRPRVAVPVSSTAS